MNVSKVVAFPRDFKGPGLILNSGIQVSTVELKKAKAHFTILLSVGNVRPTTAQIASYILLILAVFDIGI